MKKLTITLVLLFATSVFAQKTFDLKDASKYFDIKVKVAKCDDLYCEGKAIFFFYKKGGTTPYQVISLPDTSIQLVEGGDALVNTTMLYDKQSVVDVGDFNFDGMEDVALCNGNNGSYGGPSYNIYLSSKVAKKFVLDPSFTKLAGHLGMFTVDKDKKILEIFDKSGCCWHITERYDVVAGRPRKIFEMVEDATNPSSNKVEITTKTLINGKWKKTVRYAKREE
ncbi:MAG: hypothetical protein ABIP78_11650 [Pyrinomonadaceae bacterium]